VSTIPFTEWCM